MAFLIGGANSAADTGYEIANSCRFNDGDSPNLYKTQASTTSTKKFTISFWVKRSGGFGSAQVIIGNFEDTSNYGYIRFTTSNELQLRDFYGEGPDLLYTTNMEFSDPSAWYHCVVAVDSDRSSDDRARIFVNGTQVSCSETTDTGGTLGFQSSTVSNKLKIGAIDNAESGIEHYFDGYLAEFFYLDGQFLAASSFGEFNSDSPTIWQPIDCSGDLTFGDAGFYLDFEASGTLGNDANGGTDFTATNLAATDQSTDTPTNNFATMNPLANKIAASTFSEGNLKITHSSAKGGNLSTIGFSTGKWYAEMKIVAIPTDERWHWGILPHDCHVADDPVNTGNDGIMISAFNASIYANNGSGHAIINTYYGENQTRFDSFSGIMGLALDATSGTKTIAMSKDGAWITGSNTTDTDFSNALEVDISTAFARYQHWHIATGTGTDAGDGVYSLNFGSPEISISSGNADANGYGNFEYPVPSGYFSLCTKNLAEYG